MANELREFLEGLGLRDDTVEKAVELAVPDTFRKDLAEMGGRIKDLEAENKDLRPLKEAPKRAEAYGRVGLKGDLPKYARDWLDQNVPVDKLDDLEFVAAKVQEGGFKVDLSEATPSAEKTGADQITDFSVSMGDGRTDPESYEAAVSAAKTPEELDAVYARFNKQPVT